jgi:hypothetical protein
MGIRRVLTLYFIAWWATPNKLGYIGRTGVKCVETLEMTPIIVTSQMNCTRPLAFLIPNGCFRSPLRRSWKNILKSKKKKSSGRILLISSFRSEINDSNLTIINSIHQNSYLNFLTTVIIKMNRLNYENSPHEISLRRTLTQTILP